MKFLVIDTETLGLEKPIIYNIGYVIFDTENQKQVKREYLIKQVFNNNDLMNTAYYKDKIPLYNDLLNQRKAKNIYLGMALNILKKDIEKHCPDGIFAYNSPFDFRAFETTCKEFEKENPLKEIEDIMDLIDIFTETKDYKNFCQKNGYLTKHRPPREQKKAETLYKYLTNNVDFIEDHMALSDSEIELEILLKCLEKREEEKMKR